MRFRAKGPQGESPGHRPGFAGPPNQQSPNGAEQRGAMRLVSPRWGFWFLRGCSWGVAPGCHILPRLGRNRKRATPIAIPRTMWFRAKGPRTMRFRAKGPCTMRFRAKAPQGDSPGHRPGFAQSPCVSNIRIKRSISNRRTPRSPGRSKYRKSPFGDKCIS